MNIQDAIQQHRQICDELYELALEENRILQEQHSPAGAEFMDRKRRALGLLDEAVTALRTASSENSRELQRRDSLAKNQARIMQILQLDRENEQLLTRYSLGRGAAPIFTPAAGAQLQNLYSRSC
jgi:ElaB/YqjD/DUF883 family membrane-anchored ribosome-binding protein